MSGDEKKIREIKNNLSKFDLRNLNLADFDAKEEDTFHQYIKGNCQRLLGNTLDLDKQNIIFALSDKKEVNAACFSKSDVSVIYVTEGLMDLCENEDQLAFILGHELGHYEEKLRQGAGKKNSKAEETACDLRAIQKMARGGYNLEEACNIAVKLFDNKDIFISDLKDPYVNDSSRVNLINAMKKKEKDRIIEEQNIEVTQSTPIPEDIVNLVHNRSKPQPFEGALFSQMMQAFTEHDSDKDEAAIDVWLKAFHEHVILDGRYYAMTKGDADALAVCVDSFSSQNDKFADKFLAAVFADMESIKNSDQYAACVDIMHDVLDKIWSSDSSYFCTKVNADEEDSKTAVWLRRYLRGFREAKGEDFNRVIDNLEYVKKFVARHNFDSYKGIYVKNFNLLELDFNENDVGKQMSPQILQYIRTHINAKDKFVTFSGLTAHKMGSSLILTHQKKQRSTFIDSSGKIAYSFPTQDLEQMRILLVKEIIENAQNNLNAVAKGDITDFQRRLEILREAYNIVLPVYYKNDLKSILEVRDEKSADNVLYDDIIPVLPPKTAQFFNERNAKTTDNLPYTDEITNLYADAIRSAPKEYFNEMLDKLSDPRITGRLSGEDKLMRAFFDNPVFFEELSKIIKSYEPFPEKSDGWDVKTLFEKPDADIRVRLVNMVSKLKEITEFKLEEHIERGGDFDNFEQPFKKDLAKLFGFAPEGNIKDYDILPELEQTRNFNKTGITLYEQAYITYSSYDALKSNDKTKAGFLLGYNGAGVGLRGCCSGYENRLKSAEKYHINDQEQKQIKERQEKLSTTIDKIHNRLLERINQAAKEGRFSSQNIFYMMCGNENQGNGVYGKRGFNTIISNRDFEKYILHDIEFGNEEQIMHSILALANLIEEYKSTKESDIYKEKIWPSVARIFERDNLSIVRKTKIFRNLAYYNIFASDHKRYYEVLIGKGGKGGLLQAINKSENLAQKYYCYEILLNKHSRIPDPEIRADVIKNAALSYWQLNNSYNDIENSSKEERKSMIEKVNKIKSSDIAELDKIEFLKELSELTMSQKELSLVMKPEELDLQASDSQAIVAAYGLDVVAYALNQYPKTKVEIQDFLLGEGDFEKAENLVKSIHIAMCEEHDKYSSPKILDRYLNGEDIIDELRYTPREYYNKLNPQACLHFKKEFDAAPLEIKALIVNEIITNGKTDWEESFKIVSEKLFSGAGELGKVGSDFLHSYIAARPNSEKTFYLAAMMAAANNKSKMSDNYVNSAYSPEERNLAKGLRLFLENSGPAGTKLAQAMASYNDVPEFIRYEMQFAKSEANPPARWEIFSGNDETMDKLLKYGALGKRRGSASFFVTYDLGDKIVKIMRRGAKLKADNEFAIYTEMLQTLSSEYNNISSFKRLVQNAAENVHIETDLEIGEKQYQDVKKLYPEDVTANNITFKIQVMDWVDRGKDWAIMDKAQGVDFRQLSEPYKTAAAKAVFSTEMSNMLSGKRFDSDRHSGQYKFDVQNNVIGVFDTGSMSMVEPTEKERRVLGVVLARTLKELRHNQNVAEVFSSQIDKAVDEFYKYEIKHNKSVPPYLSEFQRGMLALNDFYSGLSGEDMAECIIKAMDNGKNHIHPQIVKAFKLEIKKSLDSHNVSIQKLFNPEKMDNLSPEARANRRIGKILFDAVFNSVGDGGKIDISSENAKKLISCLGRQDADLQIVKGVVRGAYSKLNPNNYTKQDKEELGMFLYHVCLVDVKNQKFKKEESIEKVIAETASKYPQLRNYTQNVMKIVSIMAKTPTISSDKLKKAAAFVAFADDDVAQGFKKALNEDKTIGLPKRIMLNLAPMDFIPHNAKKMLIKAVSKRFVKNYVAKHLLETPSRLFNRSDRNI